MHETEPKGDASPSSNTGILGLPRERRRKRSGDPLVALHYQLSHARTEGNFDAIVVADPSGVVVAGAGSWAVCEELAAYAPLLVAEDGGSGGELSSRLDSLRGEVDVRMINVGSEEVLLCARGGRSRKESLASAAVGIDRILRVA
jgi:hypothetical protein